MAYGTEAVLPVEISMKSLRIENFDPEKSAEGLRLNNELVEELRDSVSLKVAHYQGNVAQFYNSKTSPRGFKVNGLVLREAASSMPAKMGKLSPPWEGPYKVTKVVGPGAYHLSHLDGSPISNT